MQTLLSKLSDEYSKLVVLQTRLSKVCGIEHKEFAFVLLPTVLSVKKV